ncbi:MAG: alpha/beta-type small acid-soluble spore protein [Firmicutes bacterium]|nr:alpha/beta-type small acid-soluble spore protein [Bacillota bacterium]
MARGNKTNRALVPGAEAALDRFKYEVAQELAVDTSKIKNGYWGDLSARQCGAVGGNMVKRMIQLAEQSLAKQ